MPRTCIVCGHPEREAIERAVLARESYRNLAARFSVSTGTLQRHKPHLRQGLVKVHDAVEVARSERLLDCVRTGEGRAERMYAAAEGIMVRALDVQDLRTALQAIRAAVDVMAEARQYMELRGELSGELGKAKAPQWPEARIVVTQGPATIPPGGWRRPGAALPEPENGKA
jgi:hypothetical protein